MERNNDNSVIGAIRASNVLKRATNMARGKYITMISGDDIVIGEERMRKQIDCLENNQNLAGCYTNHQKFGLTVQ